MKRILSQTNFFDTLVSGDFDREDASWNLLFKMFCTIKYMEGDASLPPFPEHMCIIAHICNNKGKWGRGFVLDLAKTHPKSQQSYLKLSSFPLGTIQMVYSKDKTSVCNMIAQDGLPSKTNPVPCKVNYLRKCLRSLAAFVKETNPFTFVCMPRIGCGYGGLVWETIEEIIQETLLDVGICVFVFDK